MDFSKLKFRDRLLLIFLIFFIPAILAGSGFAYLQAKKILQTAIDTQLQNLTDDLTALTETAFLDDAAAQVALNDVKDRILLFKSDETKDVYAPLKTFRNFLFGALAFVIVSLIVIVFGVSRIVTRPLESAMEKLERGAKGDYSVRMDATGAREFITLGRYFNVFIEQIEENHRKIALEVQQKTASQIALVENDLKLRSLFDQSFQYIVILSPSGIIEEMNQNIIRFSGCSADEILYRPFWEAIWWQHDAGVQAQIKAMTQRVINGESLRQEVTATSQQGRIGIIDLSLKPVLQPSGGVAFIIAEGRDVTDLKQAAQERKDLAVQLERSQKMEAIGTLAGGIAHDFNNILSGIMGYSQLLELSLEKPEKARTHIRQIKKGAQRAADLISQILTFSRQTRFEKQPLRLYLVVKESLKLMRSSIPATIEIAETVLSKERTLADPTQMHQVIMNLCTNAYHAMMEKGGCLSVKLSEVHVSGKKDVFDHNMTDGHYLELDVSDTGHGMDSEVLSKAFDPYFTTKEPGKGTGFGLALVQAIVYEHEGFITVESQVGQGTCFSIFLPVIQQADDPIDDPSMADHPTGGAETIMVVDDEADIREVLCLFLQDIGYTVETFANGAQALDAFERTPHAYDLVITDMAMPKMTGSELAQSLLRLRKDIPVILCTGYSETLSESQCMEIGIRQYIQKPVESMTLAHVIRTILDDALAAGRC